MPPRPLTTDDLMTLRECAAWLRMQPRDLSARSRGRNPRIPCIRINQRVVRFHRGTILAKFAAEAGLGADAIAGAIYRQAKNP